MSYDIRFAVKAENGQFVDFDTPELDQPTYNVGTVFRKAMDFNFEQGTYYRVSEILPNIERGIHETTFNMKEYKQYEPDNGWGSVGTVRDCLNSIINKLKEIQEYKELSFDIIYIAW